MIDISFLKSPLVPMPKIGGLEFLDWQNKTTFYEELVESMKKAFSPADGIFNFSKGDREEIEQIIKKHTNLKISIVIDNDGNLAIDAGYINPGNILNTKGIEQWFNKSYSKFGEAFKDLKKNVITGWCDVRTGKVEGDYTEIPFNIYINPEFTKILSEEQLLKMGYSYPEVYAAFVLHECGHAWGGLYFVSQTIIDNVLIRKASSMYADAKDNSTRASVIKDASEALQIKVEKIDDACTEETVSVYFNKVVKNRNLRRCLSIGVEEMSSEVLADAYAIRMGASRPLVAGLAALPFLSIKQIIVWSLVPAVIISLFTAIGTIPLFGAFVLMNTLLDAYSSLVPGVYDTPYRRMKNIIRENMNLINSPKLPSTTKTKLITATRDMERYVEEYKPYFESTALQRTLGWVESGSDFRKTDLEHYSAELTSNTLALFNSEYFMKGN